MRFFLILISLLGCILFVDGNMTFAACDGSGNPGDVLTDCAQISGDNTAIDPNFGTGTDGVKKFVMLVADGAIGFAALFAIGALVFAGMRYTVSNGDDEKIKQAKGTAVGALIGLVLCLTAFPIVRLVINFIYSLSAG